MSSVGITTRMSQAFLKQQVGLSVKKLEMNQEKQMNQFVNDMLKTNTKLMDQSINPHLGSKIDTRL